MRLIEIFRVLTEGASNVSKNKPRKLLVATILTRIRFSTPGVAVGCVQ